jgi:hypothetical protein
VKLILVLQGVNALVGYKILPARNDTFSIDDQGFIRVRDPSELDRERGDGTLEIKVSFHVP